MRAVVGGASQPARLATGRPIAGGAAQAIVRPDWVRLGGAIPGRVETVAFRGAHTDYRLATPAGTIELRAGGPPTAAVGDAVGWSLDRAWIPVAPLGGELPGDTDNRPVRRVTGGTGPTETAARAQYRVRPPARSLPRPGGHVRYDATDDHRAASSGAPPAPIRRSRSRPTAARSATRTDASTSTPPAARSSSTSATAGASVAEAMAAQAAASPMPTAASSRPSRSRRTPRRRRATCRSTAPRSTRCRAVPRRSRRPSSWPAPTTSPAGTRSAGSSSPAGAATTATRWARSTCPGASRCAARTRAGWAASATSRRPIPYRAGLTGANALGHSRRAGRRARSGLRGGRSRHGGRVRRGADRRGDARRRGPARRLLAGDRRGLPAARRPAHRRRGDDRVRPDGPLVRARSLGRPPGPAGRGQGRHLGLLAVRVRGGVRRGPRHGRSAAPGSCTASPSRTGRSAAAVAGEVLRILETEGLVEASAAKGERLLAAARRPASADDPNVGEIRGRGLLVGLELVADRATREPFPRAARVTEARRARRARAGTAGLLRDRQRRRRRRRHDPARAAVRRSPTPSWTWS